MDQPACWPAARRATRAVLVADVVESVRLLEQDEEGTVRRWQAFVLTATEQLLPQHAGVLVKSLGDGLMVVFESVPRAIRCAAAMHRAIDGQNTGHAPDQRIHLRIGVHVGSVIIDARDIYGHGANLAARLSTLAGPGETVVSSPARDQLTDGLDGEIEDLGECFLKHLREPLHAFRVGPIGPRPVIEAQADRSGLRPAVAVVPFRARSSKDQAGVIGEILADEVIAGLSRSTALAVISRLSTSTLRGRALTLESVGDLLGARYVVSGAVHVVGTSVRASVELADSVDRATLWAETFTGAMQDVLTGEDEMVERVIAEVAARIAAQELSRAATLPLPSVQGCTLLFGAIMLMHRANAREFERAQRILEHLIERHRRRPQAHAWMAKWHVLRAVQGWTADAARETALAQASVDRALEVDPTHALALAVGGLVQAYLRKDLSSAARLYEAAVQANPSESLAWLFTATLHSYRGEGPPAAEAAMQALRLSPLDPLRYFFDSLAATAVLASGDHARTIELASRSLRANRSHTSTYRTLAIAQVLAGRLDEARATVQRLLALEPGLTVSRFVARYPGQVAGQVRLYAAALGEAGLPP